MKHLSQPTNLLIFSQLTSSVASFAIPLLNKLNQLLYMQSLTHIKINRFASIIIKNSLSHPFDPSNPTDHIQPTKISILMLFHYISNFLQTTVHQVNLFQIDNFFLKSLGPKFISDCNAKHPQWICLCLTLQDSYFYFNSL